MMCAIFVSLCKQSCCVFDVQHPGCCCKRSWDHVQCRRLSAAGIWWARPCARVPCVSGQAAGCVISVNMPVCLPCSVTVDAQQGVLSHWLARAAGPQGQLTAPARSIMHVALAVLLCCVSECKVFLMAVHDGSIRARWFTRWFPAC
jgi:hypothetical protein